MKNKQIFLDRFLNLNLGFKKGVKFISETTTSMIKDPFALLMVGFFSFLFS